MSKIKQLLMLETTPVQKLPVTPINYEFPKDRLYYEDLPEWLQDSLKEKALESSELDVLLLSDGDYQVNLSWNDFVAAYKEEMERDLEEGESIECYQDFLNSFPDYCILNKDAKIRIDFYF